jgi:hypothetical protein
MSGFRTPMVDDTETHDAHTSPPAFRTPTDDPDLGTLEERMTPGPRPKITSTAYQSLPSHQSTGWVMDTASDPAAVRIRGAIGEAWKNARESPRFEGMNAAPGPFGWLNRNIVSPALSYGEKIPAAVGAGIASTISELATEAGAPGLGRDINQAAGIVPPIVAAAAPFMPKALTPAVERPPRGKPPEPPYVTRDVVGDDPAAIAAKRAAERTAEQAPVKAATAPFTKPEAPAVPPEPATLPYETRGFVPGTSTTTRVPVEGVQPLPPGYVTPPMPKKIAADVYNLADAHYDLADHYGGTVKPEANSRWLDNTLSKATKQAPEEIRFGGADAATKTMADFEHALRDQPMSLRGFDGIDKRLGDRIDEALRAGRKYEASKLQDMQASLRDHVAALGEADTVGGETGFAALKDGRKAWSVAARMRDIERIVEKAQGTLNPQQSIRTGINAYANDKLKTRGWPTDELDALKESIKSGNGVEILRTLSSRLGPIAGYAAGGPLGGLGAAVADTLVANRARDALTGVYTARVQRLLERVAANAPDAPGVRGPPAPRPGLLELTGRALPGATHSGLLGSTGLTIEPPPDR